MTTPPPTPGIDVGELRAMLEDHAPVTVLDMRKAEDRAEWAIPGSLHVDAYEALKAGDPDALANAAIPTDAPVITICGAGKVSLTAMEQLRARGYDARSLAGGMKAWSLAWNSAEVPVPGSAATVIQVRRTGKGCLSYLIGNDGEAAVIDAALPPEVYQELASRTWLDDHAACSTRMSMLTISVVLACSPKRPVPTLHLPAQDRVTYPFTPLHDGDALPIGSSPLDAMHTPGHTLESTSYLPR